MTEYLFVMVVGLGRERQVAKAKWHLTILSFSVRVPMPRRAQKRASQIGRPLKARLTFCLVLRFFVERHLAAQMNAHLTHSSATRALLTMLLSRVFFARMISHWHSAAWLHRRCLLLPDSTQYDNTYIH